MDKKYFSVSSNVFIINWSLKVRLIKSNFFTYVRTYLPMVNMGDSGWVCIVGVVTVGVGVSVGCGMKLGPPNYFGLTDLMILTFKVMEN
jgi:hypothetical protein